MPLNVEELSTEACVDGEWDLGKPPKHPHGPSGRVSKWHSFTDIELRIILITLPQN